MNKLLTVIFSLSFVLILPSCFNQKDNTSIALGPQESEGLHIVFADTEMAKQSIVQDKAEGFFETIQQLDVAIQMQRSSSEFQSSTYVAEYKTFLQEHVLEFTTEDKQLLTDIFDAIKSELGQIKIDLGLEEIILIKTDGAGYGNNAFYTRENTIVIPNGQLANSEEELHAVMLHELFHIFSRYNRAHKVAIYKMIGFQPLDESPVVSDPLLRSRLLLNPDGLATDNFITLTNKNGEEIKAVPLIYSTYNDYKSDVADFFTYLKFDLYRLEEKDGKEIVISQGVSTDVDAEYFSSFFKIIADNTQYIIHPDEIMADNFMLMVNAYASNDFSKFSKEGKALIESLYAYLSDK